MIVDTSAVVAVLTGEPTRETLLDALMAAPVRRMSAGTYLEVCIVVDSRRNPVLSRHLDALLQTLEVEIAPVTRDQVAVARQAYRDFGRGSGHPARLNLGDCFAYALATSAGEDLLSVGADFAHTDVRAALPPA